MHCFMLRAVKLQIHSTDTLTISDHIPKILHGNYTLHRSPFYNIMQKWKKDIICVWIFKHRCMVMFCLHEVSIMLRSNSSVPLPSSWEDTQCLSNYPLTARSCWWHAVTPLHSGTQTTIQSLPRFIFCCAASAFPPGSNRAPQSLDNRPQGGAASTRPSIMSFNVSLM